MYSRRSALRHWALYAGLLGWDLLLVTGITMQVTMVQVMQMELKLLTFASWLARSYATATVEKYVYDVKAQHSVWLGLPLSALGIVFHRLPVLIRIMRKRNPPKKRTKKGWEWSNFSKIVDGKAERRRGRFGAGHKGYEQATVWVMMLLAFEQLMRLSEIVRTPVESVSGKNPLMRSDGYFVDDEGKRVCQGEDGKWVLGPGREFAMFVMRMPPSKTNPHGEEDGIQSPFPKGWRQGVGFTSLGPAMLRYQNRYPVPARQAAVVPLFGLKQWKKGAVVARFTQQRYRTVFRQLCRLGGVWYSQYGLHCMRVGGTNRLMDLGATCPQISAAGRWAGDCWLLYLRRQRESLLALTVAMAVGHERV